LEQKEKINELTIMLDQMPKPISQGRLGLIIKKSNKNLETMVKEESVLLEGKILQIENLLSSFPKPLSEGKVGLILDKRIKKLKKEIGTQINQKISSFEGRKQALSEESNLSPELVKQFKELELSVDRLTEIIGLVQLSKPVTEEITDLKSKIKERLQIDFQSDKRQVVLGENLFNLEDFALITKQFSDFAYQAIKEDLRYNKKDGIINSVINKFQLIFVQRSLSPQEGNTVDAILSRAENALNLKDYKKVIDELNELPQRASEVMLNWRKSFENFVEEKR
jgi:hypothetical protein